MSQAQVVGLAVAAVAVVTAMHYAMFRAERRPGDRFWHLGEAWVDAAALLVLVALLGVALSGGRL